MPQQDRIDTHLMTLLKDHVNSEPGMAGLRRRVTHNAGVYLSSTGRAKDIADGEQKFIDLTQIFAKVS